MYPFFSAIAILFMLTMCSGCRAVPYKCNQVIPVYALAPEPLFIDKISIDSNDAAIRYLAMRDSLIGAISSDTHDTDHDRWDQFVAIRVDDDSEDTATYKDYLQRQQSLLNSVDLASRMDRFYQFDQPIGYFDGPVIKDDPRRNLMKTIRVVAITLGDDAQRHWIDGNHDLAIDRIQTIFRIAKQIQLKRTVSGIDILIATSVANVGLSRAQFMLDTEQLNEQDMLLFSKALSELEGNDPLGFYCERTRTIRSYEAWLESQIKPQQGTVEIWLCIARFLGVSEMVNQLMQGPLGAPITVSLSGTVEPSPVGTDFSSTIDIDALLESLEDDLGRIDIIMIREKFAEYEPYIDTALSELNSENPNLAVLKIIAALTEDDETTVSDILGISYLSSMTKQYRGMLDLRDELNRRTQLD